MKLLVILFLKILNNQFFQSKQFLLEFYNNKFIKVYLRNHISQADKNKRNKELFWKICPYKTFEIYRQLQTRNDFIQ